ncbi:MAG: YbjQ family protein [Myxococcales bacterium]|nr:YbjQ family protein [Myxococcales bacterium]
MFQNMYTLPPEREIETGELIVAVAASAASVVRDMQQGIKNLMGGNLEHYEKLLAVAVERALQKLDEEVQLRGYDGAVGVRLSHPSVVEGGVEVVVMANGFRYRKPTDDK